MKPELSWVAVPLLTAVLWGVGVAADNPSPKNPPAAGENKAAPEKSKKASLRRKSFRALSLHSMPKWGRCR